MANTSYKRLAYVESEFLAIKNVYTAPQSSSTLVSTITFVSFNESVSTFFKLYVNGVVLFNSLSIDPLKSHTLILDNLGITLSPGDTISIESGPGPNVFVSVFGVISYNDVVAEVQSGPGIVYDVPADKDFICSGIAISNNSSTTASVQVAVVDDAYVTENVFAYLPSNQSKLYKTSNFNSWVTYDLPAPSYSSSSISYINGVYIYFSTPSKKVYTSSNLVSWTEVYTVTQWTSDIQGVSNVSYGNGVYVITFYGSNNLVTLHTADFQNWTMSNFGYSIYRALLMYESTSLNAFVRMVGNYIYKSTDMVTWVDSGIYASAELSVLQHRSPILNKYYGFYEAGTFSRDKLYIYDFVNLTQNGDIDFDYIELPVPTEFTTYTRMPKSIAYGNGIGVIVPMSAIDDNNGTFEGTLTKGYVSTDMQNWTITTLPAVAYKSEVIFSNGLFAFSWYGSNSWFVSSDGVTWEMKTNGPSFINSSVRSASLSYSQTLTPAPTNADVISNLSLSPAQSVFIKSGYTLSSNNGIVVSSNNSNIGVGIFGAEI